MLVADQLLSGAFKLDREGTAGTSRGVARSALKQHRVGAVHRGTLELRGYRTRVDRLSGEQVAGAHKHAHTDPAGGERRSDCGRTGRRSGVVDATCEKH